VRQAIEKQNEGLRAEGKTEVKADQLLRVAEDLRQRAAAAVWRDRAEAAIAAVDELDLRDLRSVVNAAGDAGRDEEARALAAQLREALANRLEKEQAAWLADLADTLQAGRVVRALRLSSRPPKAGAPIPGDLANQLVDAASTALTADTGQERWATVLDALAFSPIRRRVVPQSLPTKLSPQLRATVARVGTRLPEIAHIFAIEPEESTGRAPRSPTRRSPSRGSPSRGRKARTEPKPAAEANGGDGEASGNPPDGETEEATATQDATEPEEATAPQDATEPEEATAPQDATEPEEATAK
jgi:hypothetical protein